MLEIAERLPIVAICYTLHIYNINDDTKIIYKYHSLFAALLAKRHTIIKGYLSTQLTLL
jgi:mannosyltransferase OCH1-like enzyme